VAGVSSNAVGSQSFFERLVVVIMLPVEFSLIFRFALNIEL
jgi:hypothetical protein